MRFLYPLVIFILFVPFLYSCVNTREAIYFDINKDLITQIQTQNVSPVIQKNDLLSITVSSLSQEASQVYNISNVVVAGATNSVLGGYLVNDEGMIQFPVIGSIKAVGLTKEELQEKINSELVSRKLLLNPIVTVRNLSFKVTVLGEVARPTVVNVPSEKITILEAIGFAGDMTIYAKRDEVLVMREENGERQFKLLNMNSNEVFTSPYFYLKPNDIVYVKPNKTKIANASYSSSTLRAWLPTVFSALSLISIFVYRSTF